MSTIHLQDQIRWGKWVSTLSARHDWVDTDTDDKLAGSSSSQRDSKWSGRVGVNYLFDSGVSPYVSYATSFEPAVGTTYQGTPFTPLTGHQYEVGVKYRPNNSDSLFTVAFFDLTQENVLVTDDNAPVFGYQVQQGKIHSQGLELEARAHLTPALTMLASYTYTRARVKETTDPASLNKQVPLQPKHQAALWVDYRFPADIAPGLSMGAGVRYTGASYGDSANQWRASAYTLFDAQAQYNVGNWNLQLTVNNLADKQYIAACNNAMWCYYGYGRAINLSARYSW